MEHFGEDLLKQRAEREQKLTELLESQRTAPTPPEKTLASVPGPVPTDDEEGGEADSTQHRKKKRQSLLAAAAVIAVALAGAAAYLIFGQTGF